MFAANNVARVCASLTLALCVSCSGLPHPGTGSHATTPPKPIGHSGCGPPITCQVFEKDAFGADWSKAPNLIAFNAKGSDGLYHIYTVSPDGTTGSPVWNPSGRFVAFVAEKPSHPGNSVPATPGWGSYTDLWVTTADHSGVFTGWPAAGMDRVHRGPQGPQSESIRRLLGDQGCRFQYCPGWLSGPVEHPHHLAAGDAFNETGGFSADSSSLVFTSDFETHNFWKNQIYRLDLKGGVITRLTKSDGYNEHPRYTPEGQVLWMTSTDNPSRGTDRWTMNPDGSNPQRLNDFNSDAQQSGARGFGGKQVYATVIQTSNWSADNRYFYGDVQTNLLNSDSVILRVSLTCQGP